MSSALAIFLGGYPVPVRELFLKAQALLEKELPGSEQELDNSAKMLAFSYGPGYKGMICVLFPSQKGVKLSFSKGVELSRKFPFLEGNGKKTRYVELSDPLLHKPELPELIRTAKIFHDLTSGE